MHIPQMPKVVWSAGAGGLTMITAVIARATAPADTTTWLKIGIGLVVVPVLWWLFAAREKQLAREFVERQRVHGEEMRDRKLAHGELSLWLDLNERWMDMLDVELRARHFAGAAERLRQARHPIDRDAYPAIGQWPDLWLVGKTQLIAYLRAVHDVLREDLAIN